MLCEDGRITLNLAISKLRQGRKSWEDFEVKVSYKMEVEGMQINLVRDGMVEIMGDSQEGRADVLLRGVFTKIFSRERQVKMVPETILG